MGTGDGPGTDRHWPARHGGGYPPGWQVRYRRKFPVTAHDLFGTIAGPSLRDEHTSTTWVPVRPRTAAPDTPPNLVRAQDILDARPPGEPALERAADDDGAGARRRKVVVELRGRKPDGHPAG